MSTTIRRDALNYLPITCTTNPATTGGIPMRLASGALLMVESLEGGASSVTFYAKETADSDSFYVIVDASGTPITQNLFGGQAFPLPTERLQQLLSQSRLTPEQHRLNTQQRVSREPEQPVPSRYSPVVASMDTALADEQGVVA